MCPLRQLHCLLNCTASAAAIVLPPQVEKYTYEVCPYASATQREGGSSTSLGTWQGLEGGQEAGGNLRMAFTNGQGCWQGPPRSMTVRVCCLSACRCDVLVLLLLPCMSAAPCCRLLTMRHDGEFEPLLPCIAPACPPDCLPARLPHHCCRCLCGVGPRSGLPRLQSPVAASTQLSWRPLLPAPQPLPRRCVLSWRRGSG